MSLAKRCVEACARSYKDATFSTDLGHVLVDRSLWVIEGGPVILAFRGSHETRDWLTDFEIGMVDMGLGRVHRGFWQSVSSLKDQVRRFDQTSDPTPVVVTGHSKGAAEALIMAFLLARMGRPVVAVHTFGGPRVGDALWRKSFNGQEAGTEDGGRKLTLGEITYRWVHEEDIVPRLPAWVTGYRHAGQEAFMNSYGGYEFNPPLFIKGASDLWGTFWGYKQGRMEQFADHPVSRYVEHLAGI